MQPDTFSSRREGVILTFSAWDLKSTYRERKCKLVNFVSLQNTLVPDNKLIHLAAQRTY